MTGKVFFGGYKYYAVIVEWVDFKTYISKKNILTMSKLQSINIVID